MPEEESLTFDPEVDLNDDAVGKARYERFFFVRSRRKCDKNSKSSKTFARLGVGSCERTTVGSRECTFKGTPSGVPLKVHSRVEATNSRTHFKEYLQNS